MAVYKIRRDSCGLVCKNNVSSQIKVGVILNGVASILLYGQNDEKK